MSTPDETHVWGAGDRPLELMARNLTTRYVAIGVDAAIGVLMMPFNVSHLGTSAYGLWALTASITMYFSVLDLGYGGALVKFIAQYRAWRERDALNEILSTMFVVFSGVGVVTFMVTLVVASQFGRLFNVTPDQIRTGQSLLLITSGYIAIRFAASIFGAVVYGFQRFYLNDLISIGSSIAVALTNVVVLQRGGDLVSLVTATTTVRVLSLAGFVLTGYLVYPGLRVRTSLFRRARLREVTGFSVYVMVLDWSAKLNYSVDALVIGAMLSTSAVAVWTVGERLAQVSSQLAGQLTGSLFPLVVDSDAGARGDRLRDIMMHGTLLSLGLAVPICTGLAVLAGPVVEAWMGSRFEGSAIVVRLLLCVVLVRIGAGSANVILRGAGQHRLLAVTNATTAIVNVMLSLALVRPLGLAGVALGTLIPISLGIVFVLFPRACARVGITPWDMLRHAIWPAVWPAIGLVAVLWIGLPVAGTRLSGLAALLVVAGLVYQALFVGIAIADGNRRVYWSKLGQIARRRGRAPATT